MVRRALCDVGRISNILHLGDRSPGNLISDTESCSFRDPDFLNNVICVQRNVELLDASAKMDEIFLKMITYKDGPRSEENSQWNIKISRLFSQLGALASVICKCFFSFNSSIICSLVYRLIAPLIWPPSNSYGNLSAYNERHYNSVDDFNKITRR